MKGRIGTKTYDTDKAELIDTLPDGVQVYRKKGRSTEFFLYNPSGTTARTRFFDLPAADAEKYMTVSPDESRIVYKSGVYVQFSKYDRDRIKRLANLQGMSMSKFILMLVDEYERNSK